jgi:hypothetical protein
MRAKRTVLKIMIVSPGSQRRWLLICRMAVYDPELDEIANLMLIHVSGTVRGKLSTTGMSLKPPGLMSP